MNHFLLPTPNQISQKTGFTVLPSQSLGIHIIGKNNDLFFSAQNLKNHLKKMANIETNIVSTFEENKLGINLKLEKTKENYQLDIAKNFVNIKASNTEGIFYGVQTLKQLITQYGLKIPQMSIKDSPAFQLRGYYHDITRSKVPTLDTLKELVERMSYYKLNHLQLYIEHTFAFQCLPELWAGKDPLTAEEILELDEFAQKHFVELVPSLSTFGHLYELIRLPKYEHLNELNINASDLPHSLKHRMAHYTLDVSQNESFEVVQKMLKEFIPLFKSKQFNICCDETFDLGKGKNAKLAEKVGKGQLYVNFLTKIIKEVQKYDLQPMFWGDIILHSPELIKKLPKDLIYLNWCYNGNPSEEPSKAFAKNKVKQVLCPGVAGWNNFMNAINIASANITKMTDFARKYRAIGILNTDWGDYGHVNMLANSFHGLILGAACSWSQKNPEPNYFDKAISNIEWQDKSGKLAGYLREIGDSLHYSIRSCYGWVNQCEWQTQVETKIRETSPVVYSKGKAKLQAILVKLIDMAQTSKHSQDMQEFIWSTRTLIWIQDLLLLKKRFEFKQKNIKPLITTDQAILEGLEITKAYEKLWRARNKESEMHHTRNTLIGICQKLESFNK